MKKKTNQLSTDYSRFIKHLTADTNRFKASFYRHDKTENHRKRRRMQEEKKVC